MALHLYANADKRAIQNSSNYTLGIKLSTSRRLNIIILEYLTIVIPMTFGGDEISKIFFLIFITIIAISPETFQLEVKFIFLAQIAN